MPGPAAPADPLGGGSASPDTDGSRDRWRSTRHGEPLFVFVAGSAHLQRPASGPSSVELWDLLVNQRGWTNPRYGRWVGNQLIAALL